MKSPERQLREQVKDKRGRYRAYPKCERCAKRQSSGLTAYVRDAEGERIFEGYACKPCKKELEAQAAEVGGSYE